MIIEELRKALNISEDDTSYDDVLERLYALAKKIFYQNTRVKLEQSEQTDSYINFNSDVCYLYSVPVVSITSIEIDQAPSSYSYRILNDAVYFDFPITAKFLDVTYTSGYDTIPVEIDQVLVSIVDFLFNYDATKTYLSGSGEMILAPADVELPKSIKDSLAIYRIGL
jgi:hypothetical protein